MAMGECEVMNSNVCFREKCLFVRLFERICVSKKVRALRGKECECLCVNERKRVMNAKEKE